MGQEGSPCSTPDPDWHRGCHHLGLPVEVPNLLTLPLSACCRAGCGRVLWADSLSRHCLRDSAGLPSLSLISLPRGAVPVSHSLLPYGMELLQSPAFKQLIIRQEGHAVPLVTSPATFYFINLYFFNFMTY